MTPDDFKGWELVLFGAAASLGGGAVTFLTRIAHLRRLVRRDGSEDELFDTLNEALKEAERRRQQELEIYRQREQEQVRVYAQSMDRLVTLTADLAATKAQLEMLTRQYAEALDRLRVSDDRAQELVAELNAARTQILTLRGTAPLPLSDTEGTD